MAHVTSSIGIDVCRVVLPSDRQSVNRTVNVKHDAILYPIIIELQLAGSQRTGFSPVTPRHRRLGRIAAVKVYDVEDPERSEVRPSQDTSNEVLLMTSTLQQLETLNAGPALC
jgi:hypothetical protein